MAGTDKYNDMGRSDLIEALEYEEEKLKTLLTFIQGMQLTADDKESLRSLYIVENKIKELTKQKGGGV